ncbi:MAG TPA: acyl-CoA dehydrogenase family protein [Candidatus Binatia bacterium]|nr:acyl-CoA dehydrogenase family protein [Candidatus Binatia bacterium]
MNLAFSPAEETFRARVREWLRANLPDGWASPSSPKPQTPAEKIAFARRWQRKLYDGGWAGLAWPKEYGGQALSPLEQLIFHEECFAAGAPDMIDIAIGLRLTGPTLIHHGTDAQKKRFLEPILRGDEVWCQGFSEPGAGSDLAALRTRGEIAGDRMVVNGQKVWTSYARYADWCILIVRTNPSAPKHRGLTFALLDMRTPGITIRPLVEMTGVAWFNEVFFENVAIPLDRVVGEIDRGWDIAITTLSHERGTVVPYQRLKQHVEVMTELSRRVGRDMPSSAAPLVRQRLAQLAIEVEVLRLSAYRSISGIMRSGRPGPEASILKVLWSELEQRIMDAATWISGAYAQLDERAPEAHDRGRWQYGYLWSRAATIYAGTSEVQRNILSQRVLGLPRG